VSNRQPNAIPRSLLEKYFGKDPRLISHFEDQSIAVQEVVDVSGGTVQATEALQNATVVTLSPNEVFNFEFLLTNGDGTKLNITAGSLKIDADDTVVRCTKPLRIDPPGAAKLGAPGEGVLISDSWPATLYNKTLNKPLLSGLVNANTDADAATAGVPLGGMYRDGNVVCVRVV